MIHSIKVKHTVMMTYGDNKSYCISSEFGDMLVDIQNKDDFSVQDKPHWIHDHQEADIVNQYLNGLPAICNTMIR